MILTVRRNAVFGTGRVHVFFIILMLLNLIAIPWASAQKSSIDAPQATTLPSSIGSEYDSLLLKAESEGEIRVIVGVSMQARPEGELVDFEGVVAQRSEIRAAQDRLIQNIGLSDAVALVRRFGSIPFIALNADAEMIRTLQAMPEVSSIEEDRLSVPALAESIPLVRADIAWSDGYTGQGQAVAILDTGVDYNHSFLSGKMISEACFSNYWGEGNSTCPNGSSVDYNAGSGLNCDAEIDGCSHGTHVAGIAVGNGLHSGVARDSDLISIQVFTESSGSIGSWTDDQIMGLQRVLALHNAGLNIAAVNMSLGGGLHADYCDDTEIAIKAAIDNLRSHGIATVISSGNDEAWQEISSPACVSTAISVGASTDSDTIAYFSNSSEMVDLVAPGVDISSSVPGNSWITLEGTSMAAPHVAGAFAVLKSKDPDATVDELEQILKSTGHPISETWGQVTITKPRIDVAAALDQIADLQQAFVSDDHPDSFVRDADTVNITVTFSGVAEIGENTPPTMTIGDAVIADNMTFQSNLIWTYDWDVPAGHDHEEAVSILAFDSEGIPIVGITGQISYVVDNIIPTAPLSVAFSAPMGTIVPNTLNYTSTYLEASASIVAGEATGGYGELLVEGSVKATDDTILEGDTEVTFTTSDGTPLASELRALIPTGGIVSVRLYDAAGNSSESSVDNPTLIVDYTYLVITVVNPDTSPALNKTVSASVGDGILTMKTLASNAWACNGSIGYSAYAPVTFSSPSDNGKVVCFRATDSEGNSAYVKSVPISGISSSEHLKAYNFVSRMYTRALNRGADQSGREYWYQRLIGGTTTKLRVISAFVDTNEYYRKYATSIYSDFLNRAPDPGGLDYWVGRMRNGLSMVALISNFAYSSEYLGQSNEDFVTSLYDDFMNRDADLDPGGYAYWVGQLNSENKTKRQINADFFYSYEFNAKFVQEQYHQLLGRGCDPAGEAWYVNQLRHGMDRMKLVKNLLDSSEFWNK